MIRFAVSLVLGCLRALLTPQPPSPANVYVPMTDEERAAWDERTERALMFHGTP